MRAWLAQVEALRAGVRDAPAAAAARPRQDHATRSATWRASARRWAAGQINFYGFSYGTYLGQVYATLHPNRVRRFVLDGNVDPRRVWYQANLDQDRRLQKNIKIYFGWLAKHDDVYHLGTTADAVERALLRAARPSSTRTRPPAARRPGRAGPTCSLSAGYYVYGWDDIARRLLASWCNDGDAAGIKALYDGANPQTTGDDNGYAMYLATQCTDAPWPQSWSKVARATTGGSTPRRRS